MGHIWNWLFIPPIGFSDGPEMVVAEEDGEEEDDISEQDDVEICKSNGDQIFLRIHSYIILDF